MGYCTVEDVRTAVNFPATGAPITDDQIQQFIYDAEAEINDIYHTTFGHIEATGQANGDFSVNSFSDSTKSWTDDEHQGDVVWIIAGTGAGQYREVLTNDATKVTTTTNFDVAPDATSVYRIVMLKYIEQDLDGNGERFYFAPYQPLIALNELTIDGVSVTISTLHLYNASGKIHLTSDSEAQYFSNNELKQINLKYVYGVYPFPRIIQRLCVCIAGIRTLIAQIAGTYDDFTSVSMPGGFSAAKGEPYQNIKSSLDYLQGEARGIVYGSEATGQVSADFRTGASYRPFTLFG